MGSKGKGTRSPTPFEKAFDEAETLQQRAERRGGPELFQKAEQAFQRALSLSEGEHVDTERINDCRCFLGEVQQNLGDEILRLAEGLPFEPGPESLTLEKEQELHLQASLAYRSAVENYSKVIEGDSNTMRVDAAVNCANTLASLAQVLVKAEGCKEEGFEEALRLLDRAESCYLTAIQKEEDATTWNNLGDTLVQKGEYYCEHGNHEYGLQIFGQAMEAYSTACSLSSSENGDDLPGLLCNWGSGLLTAAQHATNDPSMSISLLTEAKSRLRQAISFDRAQTAPHNALGDVYVALAETSLSKRDIASAMDELGRATQEGYGASLSIQGQNTDALIGVAEVHSVKSKVERMQQQFDECNQSLNVAANMYRRAIGSSKFEGALSEKSDVYYNLACCLAASANAAEAHKIIDFLLKKGTIKKEDVLNDIDLQCLHCIL